MTGSPLLSAAQATFLALSVVTTAILTSGCTMSPRRYWESLRGEGFPEWSDKAATGVRGNTKATKPSGFFTDKRSDQIEQDLGGGF